MPIKRVNVFFFLVPGGRVSDFSEKNGISPSFDFNQYFCVVDPFKKRSQDVSKTFFLMRSLSFAQ